MAMQDASFQDVVRTAVLFGNDADTTAAVAGGLAGIKYGLAGIPARWLEQLRGFELVEPLIDRFGTTVAKTKLTIGPPIQKRKTRGTNHHGNYQDRTDDESVYR
jgi:hypothetical protein